MRYLLILFLCFQISCQSAAQERNISLKQEKAERKTFQKSSVVLKTPKEYAHRNSKNGSDYDPKPRVVSVDERSGKYELRWIGYDGKEKVVKYQRADALDAVVEAKVEKTVDDKRIYKYMIRNLPGSPGNLTSFIVQTLAGDVRDEPIPVANDVYTGHMAKYIPDFSEGVWRRFAPLGQTAPKIDAGKSIEFSLVSSALPGLVQCRAMAGDLALEGAGEHMPTELEAAMPGYAELAKCLTVGPIDKLATMSKSEKAKYFVENLPNFLEAGWMSEGTVQKYEKILKSNDLTLAFTQAEKDLENGFITNEVYTILEGFTQ